MNERIPTKDMKRVLPEGVHVVKTINGIDIYNMTIFDNIMSWNRNNPGIPAFDYFGNQITYGELPEHVDLYAAGLDSLGLKKDSVVTTSLPVSVESILSLLAASQMGSISNTVNFLFLKSNLAKYTDKKNSDTLIISDMFLPFISGYIKNTGIKNIVLTSLEDYLPEDKKGMFKDVSQLPKTLREKLSDKDALDQCLEDIRSLHGVEFIRMSEMLKEGKKRIGTIKYPEVDIEKDSIYSYTSGTTGDPKPFVLLEQAPNAIIEMHKGLDLKDYVGDRSLVLIPASHPTGLFFATYLQMAKGKTMVLQPIYDKNRFAQDLQDMKINHVLATAGFYNACLDKKVDLSNLTKACSGGEPITLSNLKRMNAWLKECGCPDPYINLGGGSGEVGSSALTGYDLDSATRGNETGKPIPGVIVKVVDENGNKVKQGERGFIEISSPAAADRYLDNEEATNQLFYYDEEGHKFARLGDITVENSDGAYSMLGRSSDSCIDKDENIRYLFDTEYALDINDPIAEWEISAFKLNDGTSKVAAQIVLKKDSSINICEFVPYICEKYNVDAVKFYDEFETSEVTAKRDYKLLQNDRENYYMPINGEVILVSFNDDFQDEKAITSTKVYSKKS